MSVFGRRVPPDDEHIRKYGLATATETVETLVPKPTPVVLGVNWYANFFEPVYLRHQGRLGWWIGVDASGKELQDLGRIEGGHAICVRPAHTTDTMDWYRFYNQGQQGACVGFSTARMMTLLNRKRYDARELYHQAQLVDDWSDTPPAEGTSVRAGCKVLQQRGPWPMQGGKRAPSYSMGDGIAAYRWATRVEEIHTCLGDQAPPYVQLLNSWGEHYPHIVHLPDGVLQRLLNEDGEACVVTDR